jgi:hypothetical protein
MISSVTPLLPETLLTDVGDTGEAGDPHAVALRERAAVPIAARIFFMAS